MAAPKAGILTGYGINADKELAQAFELAGAQAQLVHLHDVFENPSIMKDWSIVAFPGGFSFGDHLGSGKVLSHQVKIRMGEQLAGHISRGGLVLGICNGFQTLVKMGLLPDLNQSMEPQVSLIHNDSGTFIDRWVGLRVNRNNPSPWLTNLGDTSGHLEYPIRHGEGKFIFLDEEIRRTVHNRNLVAFTYHGPAGNAAAAGHNNTAGHNKFSDQPDNPNGSTDHIAGITDTTGRVLGLMPHPEAFLRAHQHPKWTRELIKEPTPGLQLIQNGVRAV